jgi:hypothetical protein
MAELEGYSVRVQLVTLVGRAASYWLVRIW